MFVATNAQLVLNPVIHSSCYSTESCNESYFDRVQRSFQIQIGQSGPRWLCKQWRIMNKPWINYAIEIHLITTRHQMPIQFCIVRTSDRLANRLSVRCTSTQSARKSVSELHREKTRGPVRQPNSHSLYYSYSRSSIHTINHSFIHSFIRSVRQSLINK